MMSIYKSYTISSYANFIGWVVYIISGIDTIYKYNVWIIYDEIMILIVYDKWYR